MGPSSEGPAEICNCVLGWGVQCGLCVHLGGTLCVLWCVPPRVCSLVRVPEGGAGCPLRVSGRLCDMLCAMCICIHMQLSDRHSVDTGRGHRDVKGTHGQMLRHVCSQAQPGCARVETASGGLRGEMAMGKAQGEGGTTGMKGASQCRKTRDLPGQVVPWGATERRANALEGVPFPMS